MTTLYKLTDENWQSGLRYTPLKWGPNVTHTTSGKGNLCGPGWLHAYTSPELAALLNPIHADFKAPVLWRAEGVIGVSDRGLKVGTAQLTTLEVIPLPRVTPEQRVRFAIFCALEVCTDAAFVQWAADWLSGVDRSKEATMKEKAAAARLAAVARARAAEAAAEAAEYAAGSAWAATAGYVACLYTAYTAEAAAEAAALGAAHAKSMDLDSLARAALTDGDRVQA